MKPRLRAGLAFAFCACVAGCAVPGASPLTTGAAAANTISVHSARDAITIGRSTKAEVIAALGKTTVVSFDSGFEVWVYQITVEGVIGATAPKSNWFQRMLQVGSEKELTRGRNEFVVLFAPSGIVSKTRTRLAPAPRSQSPS